MSEKIELFDVNEVEKTYTIFFESAQNNKENEIIFNLSVCIIQRHIENFLLLGLEEQTAKIVLSLFQTSIQSGEPDAVLAYLISFLAENYQNLMLYFLRNNTHKFIANALEVLVQNPIKKEEALQWTKTLMILSKNTNYLSIFEKVRL